MLALKFVDKKRITAHYFIDENSLYHPQRAFNTLLNGVLGFCSKIRSDGFHFIFQLASSEQN